MTAGLLPVPKARFFDNAGAPLSGGLVYTYIAGTTTPLATFTNFSATVANSNPVVLDSAGYADIWLVGSYKVVLKDSAGVQIWSEDNIIAAGTGSNYYADTGGANAYIINPAPASTGYVAGQIYDVAISVANTGASTLNVNGLGVKNITYANGSALIAGALPTGGVARLVYDGSEFQLQNISPPGGAVSFTSITLSGSLNEAKGADIPSATSTPIGAATGNFIHVTGTTTITSFDTVQAGVRRIVDFTGILILTHNATSLILPGGANITTAAGDCATFVSEGSGNWRCVSYMKANGLAVIAPASQKKMTAFIASGTFTTSANITTATVFKVTIVGGGGGGAGNTVSTGSSGGGGAGATIISIGNGLSPNTGYSVVVGTGGNGGAAGTNNGNVGIGSGVGFLGNWTAGGGAGGIAHGAGGVGGVAGTTGDINIQGGDGSSGFTNNINIPGGNGGSSYFGGGGASLLGADATPGRAYGSGGGGGGNLTTSRAGGNGKGGIVIVEWNE